jgi:UDP-N-acetylmuramoylalanine--D-glutamate ligase
MNYYSSYYKVIVLGAGVSGMGAAFLAKKEGYEVFLSDAGKLSEENKQFCAQHNIEFEEGKHSVERILSADIVVKSPGIPNKIEIIKQIEAKQIPIISEIEFAFQHTQAKTIAITGSNGKTTTSLLTQYILESAGLNSTLVGNIGDSFAHAVATGKSDIYVIEVSSFQLEHLQYFKPSIGILTNLSPDHLDRYNYSMDEYAAAKINMTRNQDKGDFFIYCADDAESIQQLNKHSIHATHIPISIEKPLTQGAYAQGEYIHIQIHTHTFMMSIGELSLKGRHNLYNSLAASVAAKIMDVEDYALRESLQTFKNASHRLEFVAKVRGVEFINDSKATNVNSTWYALECMNNKVVLILGGVDKGNDYSMLKELALDKVKAIVCLGKSNEKIISAFKNIVPTIIETQSAEDAVKASYALAESGETVLLSPACASFDLFKNYEDRGQQFIHAVKNL